MVRPAPGAPHPRFRTARAELAKSAGVSVRGLSDLERGRSRGPQCRTVQALAAALRLDAAAARALERLASLGWPRRASTTRALPPVAVLDTVSRGCARLRACRVAFTGGRRSWPLCPGPPKVRRRSVWSSVLLGSASNGADHEHPGPRPDRRYAELVGGPLDGRACCSA
ncbi:helix-turn-helix domain-containing protein [Streptomyces lavendulocolor]|uniref:helix-turn-helix domain-containing protein n=1 Tax=Streptomyces lavendulocolor TaxID=67316 RepID=UPI003F4D1855